MLVSVNYLRKSAIAPINLFKLLGILLKCPEKLWKETTIKKLTMIVGDDQGSDQGY